MAESCSKAFGRYLKTLRERRGLSLDDVRSLSQTFPDKIYKAYLSRCENGHQRLAFSKLIPLSRIYEVPSDVLVERMELDMELERLGGPETAGLSFEELRLAGKRALFGGALWDAYGHTRDALRYADQEPVLPTYRDSGEQLMVATLNCATVARKLSRYRFSFHEIQVAADSGLIGECFRPLLLERLADGHLALGQHDLSKEASEEAIRAAQSLSQPYPLAYTFSTRAQIALDEQDVDGAIANFQQAFGYFKQSGHLHDCARTLNNLAQIYFDLKRYKSARSALDASQKLLSGGNHRAVALGKLLLGEIEELENRNDLAIQNWNDAVTIARVLQDKTLRFKAEYQLFRHARLRGNTPTMRSIQRRLRRLSAWVPSDTPELEDFKNSPG